MLGLRICFVLGRLLVLVNLMSCAGFRISQTIRHAEESMAAKGLPQTIRTISDQATEKCDSKSHVLSLTKSLKSP